MWLTTFTKIPDWGDPGTDPLYAGTLKARYKVGMLVTFLGVEQQTVVTGDNDFYVVAIPQDDGTTLYKIKIWEDEEIDLGGKHLWASSAGTSWGRLKTMC